LRRELAKSQLNIALGFAGTAFGLPVWMQRATRSEIAQGKEGIRDGFEELHVMRRTSIDPGKDAVETRVPKRQRSTLLDGGTNRRFSIEERKGSGAAEGRGETTPARLPSIIWTPA
jgi:hypothetical protein